MNNLIRCCLDFIYPPFCLVCDERISQHTSRILCETCQSELQLAPLERRCSGCFQQFEGTHLCEECQKKPCLFHKVIASLDGGKVPYALLSSFKSSRLPTLSETLAALMFLQWDRIGKSTPDFLVPVPSSPLLDFERGFKMSLLLAEDLSNFFKVPVYDALKWKGNSIRQSEKTYEERRDLPPDTILYKGCPNKIKDKRILLIDDQLVTGMTLYRSAEALLEAYPHSLDALLFMR